jgi:hypothetical protein
MKNLQLFCLLLKSKRSAFSAQAKKITKKSRLTNFVFRLQPRLSASIKRARAEAWRGKEVRTNKKEAARHLSHH